MSRKKSTRDNWFKHYQSFTASGTTQREYCKKNKLGYWTFSKWKRQFDSERQAASLQQLPVTYRPAKTERIEIVLKNGISITIPEKFSGITLEKVLAALRETK